MKGRNDAGRGGADFEGLHRGATTATMRATTLVRYAVLVALLALPYLRIFNFGLEKQQQQEHTSHHESLKAELLEQRIHQLESAVGRMWNESRARHEREEGARAVRPESGDEKPREDDLPMCDEIMQAPNSPYSDGSFLTSFHTAVRWVPRADGSRRLELGEICRLKRYTSEEARQCLASSHVSMIGDSLTRYSYLSLAHFVERGSFPPRFGRPRDGRPCAHVNETGHATCSPPDQPNVCCECEWPGATPAEFHGEFWYHFFSELGGGSDGGIMRGRMESSAVRSVLKHVRGKESENELYYNSESNTTLSYNFEFGWGNDPWPLQGFWYTNCTRTGTCRLSFDELEHRYNRSIANDYDWQQKLPDAIDKGGVLRTVLPKPDIAIYNRGHWGLLTADRAGKVMPALYDWVGGGTKGGGRCFFRSTTAGYLSLRDDIFRHELRNVRPAAYKAGCSYIDFAYLTETFAAISSENTASSERKHVFYDSIHLQPWVYEELNQMLLNVLCNAKALR